MLLSASILWSTVSVDVLCYFSQSLTDYEYGYIHKNAENVVGPSQTVWGGRFHDVLQYRHENSHHFIRSFYVLFSAPATFIAAQILLYTNVGKYGLIMSGVVLTSLALQIFICVKVAIYEVSKLGNFQKRMAANIEMFSKIKQMKSLGW
jgi:hypothetical protein